VGVVPHPAHGVEENRQSLSAVKDPRRELSPGARIAIGVALLVLGVAVAAHGAQLLLAAPQPLSSDGVAGLPIGLVFAFGGLLLAVPARFARLRAVCGALLVTGFALILDWIAFGPGARKFGGGIGHSSELFGRAVFGVGAVLASILAVLMWVHGIRRHWRGMEAENPPQQP
jgi:hypothetical protein